LTKIFDDVAIFDSIDCMLTEGDMRASFITALTHLKPGGVFPLEAWRNLLAGVGFEVKQVDFEEGDCPLFVCIKPF